jgi:hypothetical protein
VRPPPLYSLVLKETFCHCIETRARTGAKTLQPLRLCSAKPPKRLSSNLAEIYVTNNEKKSTMGAGWATALPHITVYPKANFILFLVCESFRYLDRKETMSVNLFAIRSNRYSISIPLPNGVSPIIQAESYSVKKKMYKK